MSEVTSAEKATGAMDNTESSEAIRIVIADDHAVVRRGLRQVLDAEEGLEVVAEASDLAGARRYLRGHHPRVLVLDLNLPEGPSLPAIPELRSEFPATQIVVLTMQKEAAYAREALGAGALGYVLKEAAEEELVEAVRRAAVGDTYLEPPARGTGRGRAAVGSSRRTLGARGRGTADDCPRPHQRRDRHRALSFRAHGGDPPRAHPAKAQARITLRARPVRAGARAASGLARPGPSSKRRRKITIGR